ncbi:hypothetical protein HOY82DRAFT_601187 [Tuber indicum]|nr:hypothetical protein HOY82DRAFT_601187 [Tuber indicum]
MRPNQDGLCVALAVPAASSAIDDDYGLSGPDRRRGNRGHVKADGGEGATREQSAMARKLLTWWSPTCLREIIAVIPDPMMPLWAKGSHNGSRRPSLEQEIIRETATPYQANISDKDSNRWEAMLVVLVQDPRYISFTPP